MASTGEQTGYSPCYRWMLEERMLHRSKERLANYTHTLFNGGLLEISDKKYETFLKKLAKDMDHGHQWFVNEIASEVTALYVDCDFQDARPPEDSEAFGDFIKEVKETDLRKQRAEIDAQIRAATSAGLMLPFAVPSSTSSSSSVPHATSTVSPDVPPIFVSKNDNEEDDNDDVEEEARKEKERKKGAKEKKKAKNTDVDIIQEEIGARLPNAFLFKFVNALQRCVFDYFSTTIKSRDDPRLVCILLTTAKDKYTVETVKRWDAAENAWVITHRILSRKCGLHIIWPWLYATQNDMLDLREGFLRAVGQACGDRPPGLCNSWGSVIDQKIYLPLPSLRMVNCDKVEPCAECKKQVSWKCVKCRGAPPASGRVYRPEFSFNGEGRLTTHAKECLENTEYMLRLCTIRRPGLSADDIHDPAQAAAKCEGGLPVFKVPDSAPRYDGVRHAYRAPRSGEKKSREASAAAETSLQMEETRGLPEFNKRREVRRLDSGSRLFLQIEEFIRSPAMPVFYRQVVVNSVTEYAINHSRYYAVRVTGSGSKYCQNVDREHNSVRIYFHITRSKGCQQRCLCRCSEPKPGHVQPAVLCKNYASPGVALTRLLDVALFPSEMAIADRERQREQERPPLMAVQSRSDSSFFFDAASAASTSSSFATAVSGNASNKKGEKGGEDDDDDDDGRVSRSLSAKQKTNGTEFEFDAVDPDCIGIRARRSTSSSSVLVAGDDGEDGDAEQSRVHLTRRVYAGDETILARPLPPGKNFIPTDNRYAPSTLEEAQRMLVEAQQKESKQKTSRAAQSIYELFTGEFSNTLI